jgi:hypothetical protein
MDLLNFGGMTGIIKNPGGLANFNDVLQYVRIFDNREDFGLRWQSTAATPLFDNGQSFQSGVALRFPPQSKKNKVRLRRTAPLRETLHQ